MKKIKRILALLLVLVLFVGDLAIGDFMTLAAFADEDTLAAPAPETSPVPEEGEQDAVPTPVGTQTSEGETLYTDREPLRADDRLFITGLLPTDGVIDAVPTAPAGVEGEQTLASYDISIYPDEAQQDARESWQPDPEGVVVHLYDESFLDRDSVNIYHTPDGGEPVLVASAVPVDGWVDFTADGFSVWFFTTTVRRTITAGDGMSYEIEVTYGPAAGIPDNAELLVSELLPGDAGYEEYVTAAAEKVGKRPEDQILSRVFDIRIVDRNNHSLVYEPADDVSVSIRLVGEALDAYADVDVLHFVETRGTDDFTVCGMDSVVSGETVQFTTDSFSVYVVIGHEDGTVENPRVMFHFIGTEHEVPGGTYFYGEPYEFLNRHNELQTTQILADGESLELIADPGNLTDKYFYGWYFVTPHPIEGITDEYGIGLSDGSLFYTWPAAPQAVAFESPITVSESNISIGDTIHWSLSGASGSAAVDADGNAHVFVAPLYKNYNFVNFMLRARDVAVVGGRDLMARKMIALGSSTQAEVKISDVVSTSTDPVHLIFTGWEYNEGTEESPNWIVHQTIDYSGAEMCDPGRDGVYLSVNLADTESVDLYPVFVQARWVDYFSGISGSGASYVASRFRESWGDATPPGTPEDPGKNVFTSMETSTRAGYGFEGWYAFAVTDPHTGEITNLDQAADVTISYYDVEQAVTHEVTINTTALKITDGNGNIVYNGTAPLNVDGNTLTLFKGEGGKLKLYDALDRLSLSANWTPGSSEITVVYWTENAQDKNYVAPAPGDEKDDYTASAVKVLQTDALNAQLGTSYSSGSTLPIADLERYTEGSVGILDCAYLDDVGAVLAGEDRFYVLDTDLSDASVTIKGDGSTTFNVYYSRKLLTIVFHIGRDGYVKTRGAQKTTEGWDPYGNWIQFMFNDPPLLALGIQPMQGQSRRGTFTIMRDGEFVSDSTYVTNLTNIMGDYLPAEDENLYVIRAKYGAYIGDDWPTPGKNGFTFSSDSTYTMYTWAGYYDSLYCRIANERPTWGGQQGNNPDFNGVYEYMSREMFSNRSDTDLINANGVHHLVAYFGLLSNTDRFKDYHILYEAIDGTYDPDDPGITVLPGTDYMGYLPTTWSTDIAHVDATVLDGRSFYEARLEEGVISNVNPEFQMAWDFDGYDYFYSCYEDNGTDNDVYFFYRPKQYTLTFNLGSTTKEDSYFYTQSLKDADRYSDLVVIPEGYTFLGWFTNSEGVGDPFDFEHETMPRQNVVLYPVLKVLQYTVKIDPNGGKLDHRENASVSTYFTADYGTPVGEYYLDRRFIKLSDKELDPNDPTYYTGTKYYYINTQRLGIPSEGDWGLPTELRNAVYVAEDQIDTYYEWYREIMRTADPTWWTGIETLDKNDFLATYASFPHRPLVTGEHVTFMGWFQVFDDGSVSSMPFNFNDPVTGPLELRAQWRLDGGYYIQYNPTYDPQDGSGDVIGDQEPWTDPADPTQQVYADQSPTKILRAPSNTPSGWIFRGWRVVRPVTYISDGASETRWEPMQFDEHGDPIYYQPGDSFTVDSRLVSDRGPNGAIIHMQAYYEPEDTSYRRPHITNLILDANDPYGGYVNTDDPSLLPPLPGPGSETINTTDELYDGHPTQILIGDFQSNIALHLYRYATTKTINGTTGTNFFSNADGYLLIGFDENSDPTQPTTGEAYVPAFAPDSVIAVQRNENHTLYAMWEPMVYVTFVNTTEEDITIDLSGTSAETVSIVNQVTGDFDREQTTTRIVVPAKSGDTDGSVKIVLPRAAAGSDSITATATNDHLRKRMSVSGAFRSTSPYGDGSEDVKCGSPVTWTGVLQADETGIIVTYTEEDDLQVLYDVNGGSWTETDPRYQHVDGDIYLLDSSDIQGNSYQPSAPTREGKVFIGWTTNADIAAHTDFSSEDAVTWGDTTITPDAGGVVLDKVRSDYLWDFSDPPPYDQTLYAVWSDAVTVIFDNRYTSNGSKVHTWNGPGPEPQGTYVFYQLGTGEYAYTLAKGDRVPRPSDPSPHSDQGTWHFIHWLYWNSATDSCRGSSKSPSADVIIDNTYDFSQRVFEDTTLVTSWTVNVPQTFTFTVLNQVEGGSEGDEFEYTIAVSDELVFGKLGTSSSNQVGPPDRKWGSVTTTLKNNEQYTVLVTVSYITNWGGANSVEIEVTDRSGNVIKSGHVIYCNKNTYKNFVSDYKYTLTITQEEKEHYTTTVSKEEGTPIVSSADSASRSFTFTSCESRTTAQSSHFPEVNEYDGNVGDYSQTVTFKNKGDFYISPTGLSSRLAPFALMLVCGTVLTALAVSPRRRKRGKHEARRKA